MMRIPFAVLPLIATLAPFAYAMPQITSPSAGGTLPFGALTVSWEDDGSAPKLSTLDTYTLDLVLGGNEEGPDTVVFPIVTSGDFADGNSAKGSLTATQAASTKNGFYFKMTAESSSSGGTVLSYSKRFTVTGLSGVTPPNALAAVPGGTSGPANQNNMSPAVAQGAGAVAPVAAGPGDYNVPYNKQTGSMRYAPMQPFPPTKITKKGPPTPQYPTSAFSIATAKMGAPEVISTITESQTFHAMTMENTVAPQPHPKKDDMAKFLARWKD